VCIVEFCVHAKYVRSVVSVTPPSDIVELHDLTTQHEREDDDEIECIGSSTSTRTSNVRVYDEKT
jgi:hypothetical protein